MGASDSSLTNHGSTDQREEERGALPSSISSTSSSSTRNQQPTAAKPEDNLVDKRGQVLSMFDQAELLQLMMKAEAERDAVYCCDGCEQIIKPQSPRYHCLECRGFDFCETCLHTMQHDPLHSFTLETHSPRVLFERCQADGKSDSLFLCFSEYAKRPCFAPRRRFFSSSLDRSSGSENEDLETLYRDKQLVFGGYDQWYTYEEVGALVSFIGCGLGALLPPRTPIGIFGHNSMEWMLADMANIMYDFITVPIYVPASPATLQATCDSFGIKAVFCDPNLVPVARAAFADQQSVLIISLSHLEKEDFFPPASGMSSSPQEKEVQVSDLGGKPVITLVELIYWGKTHLSPPPAVSTSDCVTIMLTSGTTGVPKGIPVTNYNLNEDTSTFVRQDPLVFYSFRPLAHASDRLTILTYLCVGARVGFTTGITDLLFEEISLLRPTRFAATPRFWNKLYSEYKLALNTLYLEASAIGKTIDADQKEEIEAKTMERIRVLMGNRLESITVGGAAVSQTVLTWMKICFSSSQVYNVYGITEVGGITSNGTILPGVQVELVDRPDLGYTNDDKPFPRGEIKVKTMTMTDGYLRASEEDKLKFQDGWFLTGDIGEFRNLRKGTYRDLFVIDRVKHFFKTAQGVWISPEKLENIFLKSPLIFQIAVFSSSLSSEAISSIIVPNFPVLRKVPELSDSFSLSNEELCALPLVESLFLRELEHCGLETGELHHFEIPRQVLLLPSELSVESGLMTASGKIVRHKLRQFFLSSKGLVSKSSDSQPPGETDSLSLQTLEGGTKPPLITPEMLSTLVSDSLHSTVGVDIDQGGLLADSDILALGADSLTAVSLQAAIRSKFNVDIPVVAILANPTTERLAGLVNAGRSDVPRGGDLGDQMPYNPSQINWAAECTLPQDLQVDSLSPQQDNVESSHQDIFLTGSTGFLGVHLLAELLKSTPDSTRIFCLVRSKSELSSSERLSSALKHYHLNSEMIENAISSGRLKAVSGDLSLPQMGLPEDVFSELALKVSLVLHCGFVVNMSLPYLSTRNANVGGLLSLLKFAGAKRMKNLSFISSLSSLNFAHHSLPFGSVVDERFLQDYSKLQQMNALSGYAQSKVVCEHLLAQASQRGFRIQIHRPGLIGSHSLSGVCLESDWFNRFLKYCLTVSHSMPISDSHIDISPVDNMAARIATLSLNGPFNFFLEPNDGVDHKPGFFSFHHLNLPALAITPNSIFEALSSYQPTLKQVPFYEWQLDMKRRLSDLQSISHTSSMPSSHVASEMAALQIMVLLFAGPSFPSALPISCSLTDKMLVANALFTEDALHVPFTTDCLLRSIEFLLSKS